MLQIVNIFINFNVLITKIPVWEINKKKNVTSKIKVFLNSFKISPNKTCSEKRKNPDFCLTIFHQNRGGSQLSGKRHTLYVRFYAFRHNGCS